MNRTERLEREKAQGVRNASGAVVGGIDLMDFGQGYRDAKDKVPFPDDPSLSYELGRTRAQEDMEEGRKLLASLNEQQDRQHHAVREMLADRPDLLAVYDAKMAQIRANA